jgi:hypothetical protein
MNKKFAGITAAVLSGLLVVSSIAPAQAQVIQFGYSERDRVIRTYCDRYPNDYDCGGYYGGNWSSGDYDRFYRRNRSGLDSVASGIFGFTFGAILGSALANSGGDRVIRRSYGSSHVDACYARYRSYDERTDTFLGYDGYRHRCNL